MIRGEFDRPQLERSIKSFSKQFGESSAQAVVRWSVQVCRELALEAQPWGKKQVKQKQLGAIMADALNVVTVSEAIPRNSRNKRLIKDPAELCAWMDANKGEGKRTKALSLPERKICTPRILKAAVKMKMANAGIAKGGFLGAGQEIAKAQRGQERITIGVNFLSYANKHSRFGSARKPSSGFRPTATLTNSASHTSTDYVLRKSAIRRATDWGLKKTVQWYARTIKALDRKKS